MKPQIESLEPRRLLSGEWTTVDDFQLAPGREAGMEGITSDAAGNIYAVGQAVDANGTWRGVLRMKAFGSGQWNTIWIGDTWLGDLEVAPNGDIYGVGTNGIVEMERSTGKTTFAEVGPGSMLAIDPAGNVYVARTEQVLVGTKGKTSTYQYFWTVRKQTGGQGDFATVDTFLYPDARPVAEGIAVIPEGAAAGVYVAGRADKTSNDSWLVRRSADGETGWTTIDEFTVADTSNNAAIAVAGDDAGNVYVTGWTETRIANPKTRGRETYRQVLELMTRKGVANADGSFSWSQEDRYASDRFNSQADVAVDSRGNVFVSGAARTANPDGTFTYHAIVRSNIGGAWHTEDDVALSGSYDPQFEGLAIDSADNVFVGGWTRDETNTVHWIVRSPSATTTAATFSTTSITSDDPGSPDDPTLAEELLAAAV